MADETVWQRAKRIRNARLSMPQTFYLITLNEFIGQNADAWPSQATIAAAMNSTKRSVQNWQAELEAVGVIQVDVGKGRSLTNRYRLNLDSLPIKEEPRSAFNDEPHSPFKATTEEQMTNDVRLNDEPRSFEMTNDVRTERTIERTKKEQAFSFPEKLDNEEFKTAWSEWITFRREIKKTLTPSTTSKQLAKLATYGSSKAVQSIENSISNGWQGLFDPDGKQGGKASAATNVADEALAKIFAGLRKHDYETDRKGLRAFIGEKAWTVAGKVGWSRLRNRDQFTEKQIRTDFVAAWGAQS